MLNSALTVSLPPALPRLEVGITVFEHMSHGGLDTLLGTEPFVRAGVREYEAMPWDVHTVLGVGAFDRTTIEAMVAGERGRAWRPGDTDSSPSKARKSRLHVLRSRIRVALIGSWATAWGRDVVLNVAAMDRRPRGRDVIARRTSGVAA